MKRWDEMMPRERDALVAEKVMGWHWTVLSCGVDNSTWNALIKNDVHDEVPEYTIDISAAWEVLQRFESYQITKFSDTFAQPRPGKYRVFINANRYWAYADSECEAICLAALRAVGVEA